ncbi:hypothetical protein [Flavobacterium sp.]|uniref:hypothetical protein n=1 Tax=Flavobacterium sp. TaxID=239 RepID=UPI003D110F56
MRITLLKAGEAGTFFLEFDFHKLENLSLLGFKRRENFNGINMEKFINSLHTIKSLEYLLTPAITEGQRNIRRKHKLDFEWIED